MSTIRVLTALFLIASFAFAEEPKKADEPAFAQEVAAIRKAVEKKTNAIYVEVEKAHEAAKTDAEREAILKKASEEAEKLYAPARETAIKILRPHATEAAAAPGLAWLANFRSDRGLTNEAIGLLLKHHVGHSALTELVRNMRGTVHGWVEPTLREMLASERVPATEKPRLKLYLAVHLRTKAESAQNLIDAKADPALGKELQLDQYLQVYGQEEVAQMQLLKPAQMETEALAMLEELLAKHADVKLNPQLTIGDIARGTIFEIKNLSVGKTAPDIVGEDLAGVKFKLSDYRGKVVMLSFWATWCGPCMGMVPHERELVKQYTGRPFVLIGVNGDPDKAEIKPIIEKQNITWRSFWCGKDGPGGEIPKAWNVTGWPTVYVIDHAGIIRSKTAIGKALDTRIEKCVKAAEAAKP
jgi:thiol-disulfide isomerase/thioredoxin